MARPVSVRSASRSRPWSSRRLSSRARRCPRGSSRTSIQRAARNWRPSSSRWAPARVSGRSRPGCGSAPSVPASRRALAREGERRAVLHSSRSAASVLQLAEGPGTLRARAADAAPAPAAAARGPGPKAPGRAPAARRDFAPLRAAPGPVAPLGEPVSPGREAADQQRRRCPPRAPAPGRGAGGSAAGSAAGCVPGGGRAARPDSRWRRSPRHRRESSRSRPPDRPTTTAGAAPSAAAGRRSGPPPDRRPAHRRAGCGSFARGAARPRRAAVGPEPRWRLGRTAFGRRAQGREQGIGGGRASPCALPGLPVAKCSTDRGARGEGGAGEKGRGGPEELPDEPEPETGEERSDARGEVERAERAAGARSAPAAPAPRPRRRAPTDRRARPPAPVRRLR